MERKLSHDTVYLMIVTAVCIDAMQFFLGITGIGAFFTPALTFFASVLFGVWFSHHDLSLLDPKRVLAFFATIIGETFPPFNALPVWTFSIVLTILLANKPKESESV